MPAPALTPGDSLALELEAGRALLAALRTEQDLLIRADVGQLDQSTQEKTLLVAEMNRLARQRHEALAAAGFDAGETGMQAWLDHQTDGTDRFTALWRALHELAQQARELNRSNGMLINQHLARTQAALRVLQGTPEGGGLYGPSGQTASGDTGKLLVVG